MDMIKALENVKNLDDYVSITEDMLKNIDNFTQTLNNINIIIATVRVLKSILSIEVQYFHMYNEFGAATIMFEMLLGVPSLKKGSAFGKELVFVVQYWLSSVRKFLIHKNECWWKFLVHLLDFIQKLNLKHPTVHIYLVQYTGESLLDLATQGKPSIKQRHQILQCFNQCSKATPRELRNEWKDKYDIYFTKLAAWLPRCGDVAVQCEVLETLLRWLLPRHEQRVRRDAAARWFPAALYPQRAVQVFLDKPWRNVVGDARLFLNAINESSDSIVSVLVEKFSVGSVSLLSVNTSREHWLDLNTESRSVSMMVNPVLYKTLNVDTSSATFHALVVTKDNTTSVHMYSGPRGTNIILLKVIDPQQIFPAKLLENKNTVKVSIFPVTDVQRIDKALRTIFESKYQLLKSDDAALLDLSQKSNSSQIIMNYISEEETRFSHPPEILRRRLLEQRAAAEKSPRAAPSTASTSSLLKLPEKLKNFEGRKVNKFLRTEAVIRANVPKRNEVIHETYVTTRARRCDKREYTVTSDSTEDFAFVENTPAANINTKKRNRKPTLMPIFKDIVENSKDSFCKRCDKREYTVTSDSTEDFAFVENTPPVNINTKKRNRKPTLMPIFKDIVENSKDSFCKTSCNNDAVETFFFEHENSKRKLNHSNSADSRSPTFTESSLNFSYQDVVDCLELVISNVCENLHQNLSRNSNQSNILDISEIEVGPRDKRLEESTNSMEKERKRSNNKATAKAKPVQLRFEKNKKQTKNKKPDLGSIEKKSQIIEKERRRRDLDYTTADHLETPLSKRKRKLYSLKDDDLINKRTGIHVSETEDDNSNLTSCKPADISLVPTATSYKEIEKMRKEAAMRRKSKAVSPKKEIKNDLFDLIKSTVENNENIIIAEKGAVYNYTSSSEDDGDFRKTVTRPNTTYVKSLPVKRQNKSKSVSKDGSNHDAQINKRLRSKQIVKKPLAAEPIRELIDERMRKDTTEVLNSSLTNEYNIEEMSTELEPVHKIPRMEIIPVDKEYEMVAVPVMKKLRKQTKNTDKRAKKGKKSVKNKLVITKNTSDDESKTISPLPELEVEIQKINEPDESIIKLDKLNNKCEEDIIAIDLTESLLSTVTDTERVRRSTSSSASKTSMNKQPCVVLDRIDMQYLKSISSVEKRPITAHADTDTERVCSLTSSSASKISMNKQPLVILERIDQQSLKSISTVGKFPITAHGEIDEPPPQMKEIDRTITPRDLITEELSANVIDFYNRLANECNVSSDDGKHSKASEDAGKFNSSPDTGSSNSANAKIQKSPSVTITRLSQSEIERYLLPSRNPVFDSASSSRTSRSIRISDKKPMNDKSTRVRKTVISPITLDETMFTETNTPTDQHQASVNKPREPNKPQCDSYKYDLRKFGKTCSAKGKILSLKGSKTKESDEGNTSVTKKRKLEKEKTTASCEAVPSQFSVEDWLSRNERRPPSGREEVHNDLLSSILEKLDTTLYENRQNTRRLLAKVLAQTQSRNEAIAKKYQELIIRSKEEYESLFEESQTQIRNILRDCVRRDSGASERGHPSCPTKNKEA